MSAARTVGIVGGGLAGLALGLGLRRRGVPVVVHEAGDYPRHRVCGDFITGLAPTVAAELGLGPWLADARRHRSLAWFRGERRFATQDLPEVALGVDRHRLDTVLAEAFAALGGRLLTGSRQALDGRREGTVVAAGRTRGRSGWVGLKLHALDLPLAADLELHLGRGAYVGACALGDGRVNVCGLFAQPRTPSDNGPSGPVGAALRQAGLNRLAERIERAGVDPASVSAVAGLDYAGPVRDDGTVRIGDAYALIPPFTGHGMAMAFESAQLALGPLERWALGRDDWTTAARGVRRRLDAAFRRRLTAARLLHRFLLRPRWQAVFARLHGAGVLPFTPVYRLLH